MCKFTKDFLLGATTAAHQVEGNNIHSDCWAQEQMKHSSYLEPSLDAVDHYHRYEEDIRLLAQAGLNTYRFSIEWARIEPDEGRFDEAEVEHYRRMIRCCRENGVEPMVCMHHFSSPKWLISKGGWEAEETVEYFRRYCVYVMERLGGELTYLHWTLLDNFEWQKGFSVKFGLIAVDCATQTRTPKPSLAFLGGYADIGRRYPT